MPTLVLCLAINKGEAASAVARDQPLAPGLAAADELPDGQRIDEFVGEHDQRAFRHRVERRIPAKRHTRILERLALRLDHDRARLDQRHGDAVEEFRNAAPGARSIGHQSTAPRSELGDRHARRLAHGLPHRHRPEADELAEDLADLRRRDEVALAADRLAGGIDASNFVGEASLHELFDRQRSVPGDARMQPRRERSVRNRLAGKRAHCAAMAGFACARRTSQRPSRIMGIE